MRWGWVCWRSKIIHPFYVILTLNCRGEIEGRGWESRESHRVALGQKLQMLLKTMENEDSVISPQGLNSMTDSEISTAHILVCREWWCRSRYTIQLQIIWGVFGQLRRRDNTHNSGSHRNSMVAEKWLCSLWFRVDTS